MKSVMKAEMQAGEDIAIKEREDGSALAAMDDHVDPFEGTEDNTSASDDDGDGDTQSFAEAAMLRVTPKKTERPFEPRVVKSDA